MVTGWLRIEDDYYFMKSDGSMTTGWREMDGQYYYFNTDGRLVRGWANLDGKYYYLSVGSELLTLEKDGDSPIRAELPKDAGKLVSDGERVYYATSSYARVIDKKTMGR